MSSVRVSDSNEFLIPKKKFSTESALAKSLDLDNEAEFTYKFGLCIEC
jgi:hypothetical protein